MKKLFLVFALPFLFITGCSDDDNPVIPPPPAEPEGLYIVNEGNFQRSNASLSLFLPDSGVIYNDVFFNVNSRALGDVGNSITIHGDNAYIVVNNSDKIEIIDTETQASVGNIVLVSSSSPRHIIFDDNDSWFISNMSTDNIAFGDSNSTEIAGLIYVGANPEGMALSNGHLYVAISGFGSGNTVDVISTNEKRVVNTLHVGDNPTSVMVIDATTIAVLCTGAYNDFSDPDDDTPGKLFFIDTSTRTVTDSILIGGHPMRLALDDNGNAYSVNGSIVKINLAGKTVEENFIPGFFYSVIVDTERNKIYATNPLDFVQAGTLNVYSMEGTFEQSFDAGIIPGAMAFVK